MKSRDLDIIQQQQEYYEARAPEYDDWFWRKGRYDHGLEANHVWFRELASFAREIRRHAPHGSGLELACGTGIWTGRLLRMCDHVHAVDGSSSMLNLTRQKYSSPRLTLEQADLFNWQPNAPFQLLFMGFWVSHLPDDRIRPFFEKVSQWVEPGGWLYFIDSLYNPESTASNHSLGPFESPVRERRLDDGRTFQIIKIFRTPADYRSLLSPLGWTGKAWSTGRYFVAGAFQLNPD